MLKERNDQMSCAKILLVHKTKKGTHFWLRPISQILKGFSALLKNSLASSTVSFIPAALKPLKAESSYLRRWMYI